MSRDATPLDVIEGRAAWCVVTGDCRDVLATLPAGCVDFLLVDPPYGTHNAGRGYGRRQNWSPDGRDGRTIAGDLDLSVFRQAYPKMRRVVGDGRGAIFYSDRKTPEFSEIVADGWIGGLVWDKGAPGLGYTIRYAHESIAIVSIGTPPPLNNGAILSVIRTPVDDNRHPHAKPIRLLSRLVTWGSCPGDLILDPFAGVGSSGVAALQNNRCAILIESDPAYADIARDRCERAAMQPRLIPDTPPPRVETLALDFDAVTP